MPGNQSRSVKNKLKLPPDYVVKIPQPDNVSRINNKKQNNISFEEPESCECINYSKSFTLLKDIKPEKNRGIYCNKSSSSSLSWEDDFNNEATQLVRSEFKRMVKVLEGREPIPSHYDQEEYSLWLKTFPCLSIIGKTISSDAVKHPKQNFAKCEDIIAINSAYEYEENSDNLLISKQHKSQIIKNAVIDHIFQTISTKICTNNKKSASRKDAVSKTYTSNNINVFHKNVNQTKKNLDINAKISPVPLLYRSTDLNQVKGRTSRNSVTRSEILSSKWLSDEFQGFSSLPFLLNNQLTSAKSRKSQKSSEEKHRSSKREQTITKRSPHKEKNNSFLPPIQDIHLTGTQYRSISATPRQKTKGGSAVSLQVNSLLTNKKSRIEVAEHLVHSNVKLKPASFKNTPINKK